MKRKALAQREPNGKPKRSDDAAEMLSPAEVQRLRTAAAHGLRDPVWGSMLGYLLLTGKITMTQFAAGKRWSEVAAAYQQAMQSPSPPRTAQIERTGKAVTSEDVRDLAAMREFVNAFTVLVLAGPISRSVVVRVCERNTTPGGLDELQALRGGLDALSSYWLRPLKQKVRRVTANSA